MEQAITADNIKDINTIIKESGLSLPEFGRKYKILYQTIHNWSHGKYKPNTYTLLMLQICVENDIEIKETDKTMYDLIIDSNLSTADYAKKYDIPLITVEQWHRGKSAPPAYVRNMLNTLSAYYIKIKKDNPILSLLQIYNLSEHDLAIKYDIPFKTVKNWVTGISSPPSYVVSLLTQSLAIDASNRYKD